MNSASGLPKAKRRLFIVSAIILSFVVLELLLKLWGYAYLHLQYRYQAPQRKTNTFNVLCLGDSFTNGFGSEKGFSYPEQLSEILEDNGRGKNKFNVCREFYVNSSSLIKYLDKDINTYEPDLIIVMAGLNDRWNLEDYAYSQLGVSFLKKFDIWLSKLSVYKFIKIILTNLKSKWQGDYFLTNSQPSAVELDKKSIATTLAFHNPAVAMHFNTAESYFKSGKDDLALKEYQIAEQLEPANPWLQFRIASVYIQRLGEYNLGERHAFLALACGDSAIVEFVFMLMQYCLPQHDVRTIVGNMRVIIQDRYKGQDRIKALKKLDTLCAYYNDARDAEKVLGYNLEEIVNIARQKRIMVILMQYPVFVPWTRAVIKKVGYLSGVPVIDNYALFEEKLNRGLGLTKETLFVRDGHCNAAGYRIIAENLYKVMLRNKIINDIYSNQVAS